MMKCLQITKQEEYTILVLLVLKTDVHFTELAKMYTEDSKKIGFDFYVKHLIIN